MKKAAGDILIKRTYKIPEDAKSFKNRRGFVLAEGEATSHAHVIEDSIEMYEKDGILFIQKSISLLLCDTRNTRLFALESGIYKVGRAREYRSILEEVKILRIRWI